MERFLVFLAVVAALVIALFLLRRYTRINFVAHARLLFKAWSVWLTGIGTVLGVYLASAPDAIITTWNMLPPDLKAMLPVNIAQYISYFLIALGILSKFVRQPKLAEQRKEIEEKHDE